MDTNAQGKKGLKDLVEKIIVQGTLSREDQERINSLGLSKNPIDPEDNQAIVELMKRIESGTVRVV